MFLNFSSKKRVYQFAKYLPYTIDSMLYQVVRGSVYMRQRIAKLVFLIIACLLLISLTPENIMPNQTQPEQARTADSFVDTIGTNLHLHHGGTYQNGYDSIVKPRLLELGIRHVRDGAVYTTWQGYYDRINELGRLGIKFNLISSTKNDVTQISSFAARLKDGLESFEGPNEYDVPKFHGSDPNWVSTLRAYQQALYQAVKNNPATANMPVIGPSLAIKESYEPVGSLSAYLDYGNTHNYFSGRHPGTGGWGAGGYGSIIYNVNKAKIVCGSKAVISTETGYHNAIDSTSSHRPAPESVSGKYMPRLFLEHFNHGIPRTYNYEFINGGTDLNDGEHHFGLLRNDGSPKPAYTALKNLISLLKDPGGSFSPRSLDYALSGNTTNVHKTLLQKRDGKFYLILWLEVSCYGPDTKQQITVPSQQVLLNLNTPVSKAITYLPNTSTATITQYFNQKQLVLDVPDYPLVVELTPTTSAISNMGLKGEYYDNMDLTNLKVVRTDGVVNFNWGRSSPDPSIGADSFSVRWTGQVQPKYSETYTFYTTSDDGVRLWVDGKLLIDNWTNHVLTENRGTISLTARQRYDIKMEFYDNTHDAVAKLLWSSPSQAKELIPPNQLYS